MRPTGPTNPVMKSAIETLREFAYANESNFLKEVVDRLEKPTRRRIKVNVKKLERICDDGEIIVVPGIVLGDGNISKKLTVYAWKFSPQAQEKIKQAGGKCLNVTELAKKGANARIIA